MKRLLTIMALLGMFVIPGGCLISPHCVIMQDGHIVKVPCDAV
jgi:hypothetical protein